MLRVVFGARREKYLDIFYFVDIAPEVDEFGAKLFEVIDESLRI